jgi:probable F420-dependent oxidoreductase
VKFGVSVHDVSAGELIDIACAAEASGFTSIWLGEHVVVPYGAVTPHPASSGLELDKGIPRGVTPADKQLDPLVALAAVVSATSTIRVATGIYILTMRHPLLAARGVATLAEISGGRFMLGLGSGWLEEEFDALGIPFNQRGSRYNESLEVLQTALRGGAFEHAGRHFRFERVQISEAPVRVPIVLGGNSDPALRRAATKADAWFASGTPTLEEALRLRERLAHFRREHGRSGAMECFVRVPRLDTELIDRYRKAGFDNLLFWGRSIPVENESWDSAFRRAAGLLGLEPTPK